MRNDGSHYMGVLYRSLILESGSLNRGVLGTVSTCFGVRVHLPKHVRPSSVEDGLLSIELLHNGEIAIVGHFPAPDFDGNGSSILALEESFQAHGLALAQLFKALLGHVFFRRDVGFLDMKLE